MKRYTVRSLGELDGLIGDNYKYIFKIDNRPDEFTKLDIARLTISVANHHINKSELHYAEVEPLVIKSMPQFEDVIAGNLSEYTDVQFEIEHEGKSIWLSLAGMIKNDRVRAI